jgi:hypothetical protein
MRTALKVGVPLVAVAVIVIAVIVVVGMSGGGGKKAPPSADWPSDEVRAVSKREIEALPPAIEVVQVTNRLGKPERFEEPPLASEIPQARYAYYPVKGAEVSELWELTFEGKSRLRLMGTDRCAATVVQAEGGGACSHTPRS